MRHVSKLTAVVVLALAGLAHVCLIFARDVLFPVYRGAAGGAEAVLPRPTAFSLQATTPFSLYTATIVTVLVVAMSEAFMSNERYRFVTQLACVLLWLVIVTFCLWAFLLPMYIPNVVIG